MNWSGKSSRLKIIEDFYTPEIQNILRTSMTGKMLSAIFLVNVERHVFIYKKSKKCILMTYLKNLLKFSVERGNFCRHCKRINSNLNKLKKYVHHDNWYRFLIPHHYIVYPLFGGKKKRKTTHHHISSIS